MTTFELEIDPDYRLDAAREFLCGFVPASGTVAGASSRLILGMCRDSGFAPIAIAIEERGGRLACEVHGDTASAEIRAQLARVLSLDVDAGGWSELGRREPAVGLLQQRYPGFRPPLFGTPYEAALWGVLAQRSPMRRASAVRVALARALGSIVDAGGVEVAVTPPPEAIASLESFDGMTPEKLRRLRGVAAAALAGRLGASYLRGLTEPEALDELSALRGVGPWTASHILYRGAGVADGLAAGEPRVLRGARLALGLRQTPSPQRFAELAERWRPYRMWVAILLARALAETDEWTAPGDSAARGRRG